jgi:selenocysteine lyase/cysteine desulfurase
VCGTIQPVAAVGALCRERGIPFLLDAAQTAGRLPVDMGAIACDLVAFTGHKGLLGPTGIGGLVVGPEVDLRGSRWGGTGVRSAERAHLQEYPFRLEAGTLNTVGIVGLGAGLAWIRERGPEVLLAHETALADRFLAGLRKLPGLQAVGFAPDEAPALGPGRIPIVSVTGTALAPDTIGQFLDVDWNVAVRTGLQCAPLAHEALGTAPDGTVRFSFGAFNTADEVDRALAALAAIVD